MERVHLNFIGPLPRTEQGNEHIIPAPLIFSNETMHRRHQCTIASLALYLSVRRETVRGRSRFMYVE
jgi:hypothetical protein